MSDKEFLDADYEVIGMVNKGHGPGGELPTRALHFIPKETAPQVLAIDRRIQQIRAHRWIFIAGAIVIAFLIGVRA